MSLVSFSCIRRWSLHLTYVPILFFYSAKAEKVMSVGKADKEMSVTAKVAKEPEMSVAKAEKEPAMSVEAKAEKEPAMSME